MFGLNASIFGMGTSQDSKHVDPQEIKCTAAASEPVDGTDTTYSEPNEENKEENVETKPEANEGETCERGGGVNTLREEEKETAVEKKEEVKEQTVKEQNNETGVNGEGNEGNNESLAKENHINKADDICEEEGKLKNNKGQELRNSFESQTEQKTEDKDKKEIKENKDHVQDKERNPSRKSGKTSSSALKAPIKSSVCPRAARSSARRDAMAKFQKDE